MEEKYTKKLFYNRPIDLDGNCFFRAINKHISGEEIYHLHIRNIIYFKNKDSFKNNNKYIHDNNYIILIDEYSKQIKKEVNFYGELEIYAVSKVFNISIYLYEITIKNHID